MQLVTLMYLVYYYNIIQIHIKLYAAHIGRHSELAKRIPHALHN